MEIFKGVEERKTMTETELRQSILDLAQMEIDLDKKGGPRRAGKLFKKIVTKIDEILESFGLPSTPYYQGLLEYNAVPYDKELDGIISLLRREAENQKNKKPQTELEILINAQKTNRDPMFILPQLGITPHSYTLYVYNKILMYVQDDFQNILDELKTVNNPALLGATKRMNFSTDWIEKSEETIAMLEAKGLKYIRQYALEIISRVKG
jgi:hypothetical protein